MRGMEAERCTPSPASSLKTASAARYARASAISSDPNRRPQCRSLSLRDCKARLLISVLLVVQLVGVSGCASFHPRIEQPRDVDGTFSTAVVKLRETHSALSRRIRSQELITGVSNLTTFAGLGGAGISAIFKGSRDLILGLVAVGSTSSVAGGLYGNPAQTMVYSNGLDAIVCIENSYGALIAADRQLRTGIADIENATQQIEKYVKDDQVISATQRSDAEASVAQANAAIAQAKKWQGEVNIKAGPTLISALTGVITTINNQLRTVIPDASAFARAGSGLQNVIASSQTPPTAPAKQKALDDDAQLSAMLQALTATIESVLQITSVQTTTADVTCKVADATPIAPLSIVLPGGATEIDIKLGSSATYQITGGTTPYISVQWSPVAPSCFVASILSPTTLQLTGTAGCNKDKDQTFNFDVYDVSGHHLPKLMVIKVEGS